MSDLYEPKPGTVAYKVMQHLQSLPTDAEVSTSALSDAIGLPSSMIPGAMQPALDGGVIFKRQKDRQYPKAPYFWSLTNHSLKAPFVSVASDEAPRASSVRAQEQRATEEGERLFDLEAEVTSLVRGSTGLDAEAAPAGVSKPGTIEPDAAQFLPPSVTDKVRAMASRPASKCARVAPAADPSPPGAAIVIKNAAFWLTGQLALEAGDGRVFLLDPESAQRLARFAARFACDAVGAQS